MKKIAFLLAFLMLSLATAQENKYVKIDSLLAHFYKNNKFLGGIAIAEKGRVIFQKNYGFLDATQSQKTNKNTKYKIGSVTKTFTATVIMQLIEERKLRLDGTLTKFFPKLPNADKITIHQLLHHRSGILDYINADSTMIASVEKGLPKEKITEAIMGYSPVFEPNSKYEYSNSNYYLLGLLIEKITKKTYQENILERIIKPLNLQNTYYPTKINVATNETFSFVTLGNGWEEFPEWNMDLPFASGGLVSTPTDLVLFMDALFTPDKLLKKASIEQMKTMEQGYGKGLMQMPFGDRKYYGHGGRIEQFNSLTMYNEAENVSIAIINNGIDYNFNDLLIGVLSIYYQMPFPFPDFNALKIDASVLDSYAGVYISAQLPIELTIKNENGKLTAQATGQGAFPLTPKTENTFIFAAAGVEISFSGNQLTLKQAGNTFVFEKKKE